MPCNEVICANCVPAFTYTSVPASMPSWLTQAYVQTRMAVRPISRLMAKNGSTGTRRSVKR